MNFHLRLATLRAFAGGRIGGPKPFSAIGASILACAVMTGNASAQQTPSIREAQEHLMWLGHYSGLLNGEMTQVTQTAICRFRVGEDRCANRRPITAAEFARMVPEVQRRRQAAGFQLHHDAVSGIEVGLPHGFGLVSKRTRWGMNWTARDNRVSIDTLRIDDGRPLSALFELLRGAVPGRQISYSRNFGDWFVIEGKDRDGRRFYVRAVSSRREIRAFAVSYPQSSYDQMFPIVIAMSNSFSPFGRTTAPPAKTPPPPPPPPPAPPTPIAKQPTPPPAKAKEPAREPPRKPTETLTGQLGEACQMYPNLC